MTISELNDLLFHNLDAAEIFMRGVWMQAAFELVGLTIATIRLMKSHGN